MKHKYGPLFDKAVGRRVRKHQLFEEWPDLIPSLGNPGALFAPESQLRALRPPSRGQTANPASTVFQTRSSDEVVRHVAANKGPFILLRPAASSDGRPVHDQMAWHMACVCRRDERIDAARADAPQSVLIAVPWTAGKAARERMRLKKARRR